MINLFTLASTNGPRLSAEVESVRASLNDAERDSLDRFGARVESDGRIAINMRVDVLLELVTASKYLNMYEWAEESAQWSSKSVDDILQERLGPYYQPRLAFEAAFESGNQFRYGALNIGGVGTTQYGEFCAVVTDDVPVGSRPVAYLRGDSLKHYVASPAAVDLAAVERDATAHSHRHQLAALKHRADVCHVSDDRWPNLLCSGDDFIEAIFLGGLTATSLERVRIAKSHYDPYFEFAFEDFRMKLGGAERVLVANFSRLVKGLKAQGIALEVVND